MAIDSWQAGRRRNSEPPPLFTFADTEEIYIYDASEGTYGAGGEHIIRDETQRLLGDRTTNHLRE